MVNDIKRIVLFDIDGTILYAGKSPAQAILKAIEEVFVVRDVVPPRGEYSFAGKTDPEIVTDLLVRKGFSGEEIQNHLEDVFHRYIFYLKSMIPQGDDAYLHPGVLPLIQALRGDDSVLVGLLTGNIEEGARIKLDRFGISDYFRIGAFGSDSHDRNDLPGILLDRAREFTGHAYQGEDVAIVGDTIYDIQCARTIRAKSVAVATGTTSRDDLLTEGPDHIFQNMRDTHRVMKVLTR